MLSQHCYQVNEEIKNKTDQDIKEKYEGNKVNVRIAESEKELIDWKMKEIIRDSDTGYLGIIYINDISKNMVLAHRGTDTSDLFDRMNTASSIQQDLEGVVMGKNTEYLSKSEEATEKAVEYCKNEFKSFALSFTGHALGAWLAELSVFYCHNDLKFKIVRAVSFDGPGTRTKMEELNSRLVNDKIQLEDLDIVAYLAFPNLINCTHGHIGKVFEVFVWNETNFQQSTSSPISQIYNSLKDHSLKNIMNNFVEKTGKPKLYKQVKKWPIITYTISSNFAEEIFKLFINQVNYYIPQNWKISMNEVNTIINIKNLFNCDKIDVSQYLDSLEINGKTKIQEYYEVEEISNEIRLKFNNRDDIQVLMKCIKQKNCEWLENQNIKIGNYYDYKKSEDFFEIKQEFREKLSIEDIKESIRKLCQKKKKYLILKKI